MKAFNFLTKRAFYINLLIAIALVVIIIEVAFFSLKGYTRHGEEIVVPNFVGLNCDSILEQCKDDFNFVMLDSVYTKNLPEGSIYQQDPLPNSNVKKGRNLYYVKVSEAPEKVVMPNLKNLSLRQAMVALRSNGLKISELEFVDHFARNAIVEQEFKGEVIEPGTELVKGSSIKLKVGYGRDDVRTHLPNLLAARKSDVRNILHEASLNIGREYHMDEDEHKRYRVYKMNPAYDIETLVKLGSTVDVWYRSETNFDFDSYERELKNKESMIAQMKKKKLPENTIKYVTDSFDYILKNRRFLYDSISREYDMNIAYTMDFFRYVYLEDTIDIDSVYREAISRKELIESEKAKKKK
ncbi:MAG: PASTA domain-containing protein [Bacteroidales bacterium]|nr:PASTA domain-containing protein [Bacteroidales bacterium]